ncbi:hypothetical protein KGY79_11875 [Candidatus Bipolaricaulota bacterium]|nr:hypothetical protein [Candidatus Bipolaricaulota bacterium]
MPNLVSVDAMMYSWVDEIGRLHGVGNGEGETYSYEEFDEEIRWVLETSDSFWRKRVRDIENLEKNINTSTVSV